VSPAVAAAATARGSRSAPAKTIRILVVDDSAVARAVLTRMLAAQPDFEVVGEASSADQALDLLARVPVDLILLDVEMPGTSGLEALPRILAAGRGARVLIVSCLCEDGAEAAVRALGLGAADTLPKPGSQSFAGRFSEVLAERVRRLAEPAAAPSRAEHQWPRPLPLRPASQGRLGCLAIGASTGGLHAIGEFLKALPPRIGVPVLVAQHLPSLFIPFFARQLESLSGRTVAVAEEGMLLRPDAVLLAPGDAHLSLDRRGGRIVAALDRAPAPSGCMPSADVTLAAVAEIYGRAGLAIVLSGMGRDGLLGARSLVAREGEVFVQDQQSSAVWGMPRAIAEAGLAAAILPPAELAARVAARVAARAETAAW
jgi:two-component system chemotaxis response regulator CheB